MAASEVYRYKNVLGHLAIEYIYVDADTDTSLADVLTFLQNPFGVHIMEVSYITFESANDSQTKASTPLAVFSAASGVNQKKIDLTDLTATKFYKLTVMGF
jgi:hypothetical protein